MKKGKAKFDELDVDKSGYLEASEIQVTMDWMMIFYSGSEEPLPAEELEVMKRDMMGLVDVDNDGRISLAEFVVVFNQVEQKREEIRRRKSL